MHPEDNQGGEQSAKPGEQPAAPSVRRSVRPARADWVPTDWPEVRLHRHADHPKPLRYRSDLAAALKAPPQRITRLVIVRGRGRGQSSVRPFAGAVIPLNSVLDPRAMATTMNWSDCESCQPGAFELETGYSEAQLSPICLPVPVALDQRLLREPLIYVSAGAAGCDLEIAPGHLIELSRAKVGILSV